MRENRTASYSLGSELTQSQNQFGFGIAFPAPIVLVTLLNLRPESYATVSLMQRLDFCRSEVQKHLLKHAHKPHSLQWNSSFWRITSLSNI